MPEPVIPPTAGSTPAATLDRKITLDKKQRILIPFIESPMKPHGPRVFFEDAFLEIRVKQGMNELSKLRHHGTFNIGAIQRYPGDLVEYQLVSPAAFLEADIPAAKWTYKSPGKEESGGQEHILLIGPHTRIKDGVVELEISYKLGHVKYGRGRPDETDLKEVQAENGDPKKP